MRHLLLHDLDPGEEEEEREPETGEERQVRVGARPPEHVRADRDPERDLEDDGREHDVSVEARQERGADARCENEDQRSEVGRGNDRNEWQRHCRGRLTRARPGTLVVPPDYDGAQ